MRVLSKNYQVVSEHEIIVRDIVGFDPQDIRLIVDETINKVVVSSLKKGNVLSVVDGKITLDSASPALAIGDVLTIEIEKSDYARDQTLRDMMSVLMMHMHHEESNVEFNCVKVSDRWYYFTGEEIQVKDEDDNVTFWKVWKNFGHSTYEADRTMYSSSSVSIAKGGQLYYSPSYESDYETIVDAQNDNVAKETAIAELEKLFKERLGVADDVARDSMYMISSHLHDVRTMYNCAKSNGSWYFYTGRKTESRAHIWRSLDPLAEFAIMYTSTDEIEARENHMYSDEVMTEDCSYEITEVANDQIAKKGDIPTDYAKESGLTAITNAINSLKDDDLDLLKQAMANVIGSLGEKAQFTLFEIVNKLLAKVENELVKSSEIDTLNNDRTTKYNELIRLLTIINNTVGGYTTERIEKASEDILEQTELLNENIQSFTGSVNRIADNNTQLAESNRDLAGAVNNFANSLSSLQESYQPETPTAVTSAEIHAMVLRVTGYLDLIVS